MISLTRLLENKSHAAKQHSTSIKDFFWGLMIHGQHSSGRKPSTFKAVCIAAGALLLDHGAYGFRTAASKTRGL